MLVKEIKNKELIIGIGSKVVIKLNGKIQSWEIVSFGNADVEHGKISCEAPLARLILGLKKGDTVKGMMINKEVMVTIKDVFNR